MAAAGSYRARCSSPRAGYLVRSGGGHVHATERAEEGAMRCPICHVVLEQAQGLGGERDWCPDCGGIWAHRGELERLLGSSGPGPAAEEVGLLFAEARLEGAG
ncbi:MAG: zf-TFIIB domain-containing protein [Acidimicrobiales bacterium]